LYEIFGVEKKHAWFDASWEQQKQVFVTSGEEKKQASKITKRLRGCNMMYSKFLARPWMVSRIW